MENKEERMAPLETQLKVLVCTNDASAGREQCFPHHDSEIFYTKLTELLESTGLSLIFNVRETSLDLYLLYLEVTRRGGYCQVGREKKWGEVAFALKLEGNSVKLSAQVEKLYTHVLYQFEQLYFYRLPSKQAGPSSTKDPIKKRNSTNSLPHIMDTKATEMSKDFSCHMTGAGYVEQPVLLPPSSNGKEMKKRRRGAPLGRKNAYQIFLKHECARLKTCSQDLEGHRILRVAIEAWRNMSEIEKQPYVEESKKINKEEIKEAVISHNKQQSNQDTGKAKWPNLCGDYLVSSQPEADDSLVNKQNVGLALTMTEKAPKDPSFLMDWYSCHSLDLATRESE